MAKKNIPFSEVEISKNFSSRYSTQVDWEPNTNIIETGDTLIIEMELAGVHKEDVSVLLQGSTEMVIKGTKQQPRLDGTQVTYHLFEREFGAFYKRIVIDFPVDEANIKSVMENGVLIIEVPRKKAAKILVDIK